MELFNIYRSFNSPRLTCYLAQQTKPHELRDDLNKIYDLMELVNIRKRSKLDEDRA